MVAGRDKERKRKTNTVAEEKEMWKEASCLLGTNCLQQQEEAEAHGVNS